MRDGHFIGSKVAVKFLSTRKLKSIKMLLANILLYQLKKLNMEELIKSIGKILLQELIKTLKMGKSYKFASDFTDNPYYGQTDSSNEKFVIRGQAKSQQTLYSYASLY